MKWGPSKFNDLLALIIVVAVFGIFAANGAGLLPNLSEAVIGALITLLVGSIGQYYYRKRPTDEPPTQPPPHG